MNNITSEESNITSEIPQNNHLLENESLSIKTLIAITILLIYICVLDNKIQVLEYKNANLQFMIEDVVNYSDSTADTGEFDKFIASPQGERFFNNYSKLYDK